MCVGLADLARWRGVWRGPFRRFGGLLGKRPIVLLRDLDHRARRQLQRGHVLRGGHLLAAIVQVSHLQATQRFEVLLFLGNKNCR